MPGGGLYLSDGAVAHIRASWLRRSMAGRSGGAHVDKAQAIIEDSMFAVRTLKRDDCTCACSTVPLYVHDSR